MGARNVNPQQMMQQMERKMMMEMMKMMAPVSFKAMGNVMGGMASMQMPAQGKKRKAEGGQQPGGGKKRKASAVTGPIPGAKNKLLDGVQLLITKNHQRNMSKGDVDWVCQEEGEGKYTATVTISDSIGPEGGKTFEGDSCDSKKAAEASAAIIAWEGMKDVILPLEKGKKRKVEYQETVSKPAPAPKAKAKEAKGPPQKGSDPGPMNKFLNGVQLIITKNHQRNMAKDDLEWVCQEQGEGKKTYQTT